MSVGNTQRRDCVRVPRKNGCTNDNQTVSLLLEERGKQARDNGKEFSFVSVWVSTVVT